MADIRWQQRLCNFSSALHELQEAIELAGLRPLTKLEKQGLIQTFEFTHELAWNVIKDYFVYQGNTQITGSRDATREAFKIGLLSDGDTWMEMITSRNQTTHTYNQKTADEISEKITQNYFSQLKAFQKKMESLKKK